MKKHLISFITLAALAIILIGCNNEPQKEVKQEPTASTLYVSYKPYTRWWWFSSEIDTKDVCEQLVWLRDHGFGGVEIAWIYPMGLDSTRAHPAFLSPEWAVAVNYAKKVADSLGLGCDFTYGTLWPFSGIEQIDLGFMPKKMNGYQE